MLSSLLTLGAKYVPSLLRTVGSGVGKLIGGSSLVKTLGGKIKSNHILKSGFHALKSVGSHLVKSL